jgi:hypothetical protein
MTKLKLSHSALNKYTMCGQLYKYHYIDKIRPKLTSSALPFGSAIDAAIESMLKNEDYIKAFIKKWEYGILVDGPCSISDNLYIQYLASDLDLDLLEKEDWILLDVVENKHDVAIAEAKSKIKTPFPRKKDKYVYNYACWLSLKRKGILMLKAFNEDIKPRIKEVIATQKYVKLINEEEDSVVGYVDLIAKLDDDKIYVIDVKTASKNYEEDSVRTSAQLASYCFSLKDEIKFNGAGFAVMHKKINKEEIKTCVECGHVSEGRHKTCPAKLNGKRCGGEWEIAYNYKATTQLILDSVPNKMQEAVVQNYDMANRAIKADVFIKDYAICNNMFGKRCPYYDLCHGKTINKEDFYFKEE